MRSVSFFFFLKKKKKKTLLSKMIKLIVTIKTFIILQKIGLLKGLVHPKMKILLLTLMLFHARKTLVYLRNTI